MALAASLLFAVVVVVPVAVVASTVAVGVLASVVVRPVVAVSDWDLAAAANLEADLVAGMVDFAMRRRVARAVKEVFAVVAHDYMLAVMEVALVGKVGKHGSGYAVKMVAKLV